MSDPLFGTKLGDYNIESLLGRGGMARVYRGYDENLDRYAAVKVIETHLIVGDDRDEYYQRFQREARSIARLRHPNIVNIYQFGQVGDNYYMAMGFVEGEDLRYILKRHAKNKTLMSHALVLKVMKAMASALDYAHIEGVIHRDIKPSNILVTDSGNAVLTDFGLALSVPEGTLGNTFGSAHYIAPEQAVSSAQAVPQSDLYSLGICLYEMLTGRVPFDDASAMSVALKQLSDPPPPPSQINPNIHSSVEKVILKVLEKEPEDRYDTGEEFVNALERAFAINDEEDTHDLNESVDATQTPPTAPDETIHLSRASRTFSSIPSPLSKPRVPEQTMPSVGNRDELLGSDPTTLKQTEPSSDEAGNRRFAIWVGLSVAVIVMLVGVITFLLFEPSRASNGDSTAAVAIASVAQPENTIAPAIATEEVIPPLPTEEVTEATEDAVPSETVEPTATVTRTDTAEATATHTATRQPTAVQTEEMVTATPEEAEATEEATTVAALPEGNVFIEARYDRRTFVLYNSSDEIVNAGGLTFVRERDEGGQITFRSNTWVANASQPPSFFPSQDCFQIWTTSFSFLPAEDYCDSRHSWRSVAPTRAFWLADGDIDTFDVLRGDEVIATCDIGDEVCQIPVILR